MTNTDASSDDEQSYQLSRRNLLRAGGAAAGVGAAGGIPAATGIEQPVGEAEGVAVSGSILAAGVIGLGIGVGGTLAYDALLGQDASDVANDVTRSSIYDQIETTMIAQQSALADMGDELGVNNSSQPDAVGNNLVAPDANPHTHTMIEEAYAAAAEEWADGASLSEAQSAALTAARVVSVTSEWTILANWNAAVNAASEALLQHYTQFGTSREVLRVPDADVKFDAANTDIHQVGGSTGDGGVLLVRNLSSLLPISIDDLPTGEQPDSGFTITEIPTYNVSTTGTQLITPYPYGSSRLQDIPNAIADYSYPPEIRATYQTQTTALDVWRYRELLNAVEQIRSTVESNLDNNVSTLISNLDAGNIELSDVISARQLYQSYESPSDLERGSAELMAAGVYDVSDSKVTISYDGDTYTGTLFIEIPADVTVAAGETISASEHEGGYILTDTGQVRIPGSADISIESIADGGSATWERRESYAPDGSDLTDINSRLEKNQQRYQDVQTQVKDLGNDGPLGGGGGIDGLLGDNGILIVGGAAVAAYLLGR